MTVSNTAKMAENAQNLPKWQALQILCQTHCQIGTANIVPKYVFTFHFFPLDFADAIMFNASVITKVTKKGRNDE